MIPILILRNEIPNHTTETVIAIAPIKTKTGGKPKYTSDKIPRGINKPVSANQEMAFTFFSLSLKRSNKYPIKIFRNAKRFP